jgi:hypothetical protein
MPKLEHNFETYAGRGRDYIGCTFSLLELSTKHLNIRYAGIIYPMTPSQDIMLAPVSWACIPASCWLSNASRMHIIKFPLYNELGDVLPCAKDRRLA